MNPGFRIVKPGFLSMNSALHAHQHLGKAWAHHIYRCVRTLPFSINILLCMPTSISTRLGRTTSIDACAHCLSQLTFCSACPPASRQGLGAICIHIYIYIYNDGAEPPFRFRFVIMILALDPMSRNLSEYSLQDGLYSHQFLSLAHCRSPNPTHTHTHAVT